MAESVEDGIARITAENERIEKLLGKYAVAKHRRHNIYWFIAILTLALVTLQDLLEDHIKIEGLPFWFWACASLGAAIIAVVTCAAVIKTVVFLYDLVMAAFVDKDVDPTSRGE